MFSLKILNEMALDIENITLNREKEVENEYKKIRTDARLLQVYSYKNNNAEYFIVSFFRNGALEVHFQHLDKKKKEIVFLGDTNVNLSAMDVFAAVSRHLIDRVSKKSPAKIKILGEEKRLTIYKKLVEYVIDKYLPEYVISKKVKEEVDGFKLVGFLLELTVNKQQNETFNKLGFFDKI